MSEVTGRQLIRKHRHRDGPQCAVTQTGGDEEGRIGDKFHEVVWTGDEVEPAAVRYVMVHVTTFTCTRTNTSLTCYKYVYFKFHTISSPIKHANYKSKVEMHIYVAD